MMQPENKSLNEVVVVGYGTQVRKEVTGAVSKIGSKEITSIPVPSVEAALQGKAAGVQISIGSGLAGSASVVKIRGIASVSAGSDPLYVVDGIPISNSGSAGGGGHRWADGRQHQQPQSQRHSIHGHPERCVFYGHLRFSGSQRGNHHHHQTREETRIEIRPHHS